MISYAQNGEDVVLARLFRGTDGFFVDLGAGHPVVDSVTKHFSDLGWDGINVEPQPEFHALLCAERPGQRNLQVAVADHSGAVTLHVAPPDRWGRSTIVEELIPTMATDQPVGQLTVPCVRLTDLLAAEGVERVDFLKIDVEGAEAAIVNDTDWSVIRPRALVIEATVPGEPTPAFDTWEPTLLDAGYVCTLFDGLNRFYADANDREAIAALSVPANVHDDVLPYQWLEQVRVLEEQLQNERTARTRLEVLGRDLAAVAEEARRLARQADPGAQVLAT